MNVRPPGRTRRRPEPSFLAFLALVLLVLAAVPAAAASGHYLEEELVKNTPSSLTPTRETTRTWLVAGKMRKEETASGMVTILRTDRGLVWVLDPAQMTYFELTRGEMDRLGELSMSILLHGADEDTSSWLQKTGRTRTIGSFEAYEVKAEDRPLPGIKLSLWLSPAVPIDRKLRDQFGGGLFGAQNPASRLLAGLKELDGYPVEVTLLMRLGAQTIEMRQTLKKVERVEVADSRFELPDGFHRVTSPFSEMLGPKAAVSPTPSSSPSPSPLR